VPALTLTRLLRFGEGRTVKRLAHLADEVLSLEDEYADLTDAELRAKTDEFKQRYIDGESLDELLLEAFAAAREASWRVLNQKHYKVQVMGGAALHIVNVDEMKTV
jgi:preprotein translocase subunit SecA